jgi:lambda repressor-like predicted transcriptional regulator
MSFLPPFSDSRERTFWVQAALRHKGSSFAAIGRKHGWSRITVAGAMHTPCDPQERAIAAELGVTQQELFPERFDATGKRLHHVRHNTAGRGAGNVKNSEAA